MIIEDFSPINQALGANKTLQTFNWVAAHQGDIYSAGTETLESSGNFDQSALNVLKIKPTLNSRKGQQLETGGDEVCVC